MAGAFTPMTPGIETKPCETVTSGSFRVAHRRTSRPNFHAAKAAYLRNSDTVERLSQPARAQAGGHGVGRADPVKALRTASGPRNPDRQREVVEREEHPHAAPPRSADDAAVVPHGAAVGDPVEPPQVRAADPPPRADRRRRAREDPAPFDAEADGVGTEALARAVEVRRQVCQKPGPRATRSPLTTPAWMRSGSVVNAHQSLRRSLLAREPPASTWKPAVAVPHRNPRGNGCRADAAGARAAVRTRTAVAVRQTR